MSQKASPTVIGAFVLGAVFLIVAGVLTFGSGRLFRQPDTYVLFFEGSAKGLNVGAPVAFRGVKIGTVRKVQLVNDLSTETVYVGVIMEVYPDSFYEIRSKPGPPPPSNRNALRHLIEELGLRAKLSPLSLVTGQLYVDFDFYPGTPAKLYGFHFPYPELPTLPSTLEEMQTALQRLLKALETLPLRRLLDQLTAAAESVNRLASSPALEETPALLNQSLHKLLQLTAQLNERIAPLTDSLKNTSDQAGATLADVQLMLRDRDSGEVVRLAESLDGAAAEARKLLTRVGGIASGVDRQSIEGLVRELSAAARSLHLLADYLERHPEALLRGKN
ncbi:MAG TPA: MCE family protein [Gammaproteobacteria bacterium]|nr:MCE family protein [Gammaproteobacteria bacterium]